MKIFLRQIPPEGLLIETAFTAEQLDLLDQDFPILTPIALTLEVQKAGEELCVHARAAATYSPCCRRCLERVEVKREDEFDIYRDIDPSTEYVDVRDDLREELILAMTSSVFTCRKDCRGICPNCGRNLNQETCACPPDVPARVVVRSENDNDEQKGRIKI